MQEAEVVEVSAEQAERMVPAPGWLIFRPVTAAEAKTAGGIALPQSWEKNTSLLSYGRVVACGEFQDTSGHVLNLPPGRWPLRRGDLVVLHPGKVWMQRATDSATVPYLWIETRFVCGFVPEIE